MKEIPDFQKLWDSYASGDAAEVKKQIGGQVDRDWITNTCTIRISRSFNYAGSEIPVSYTFKNKSFPERLNTVKGGDGKRYAYRVKEFKKYLIEVFGQPTVSAHNPGGIPDSFKDKKGVVCFEFSVSADSSYTGHFDLWNGSECINHEYFSSARDAFLWCPKTNWQVVRPAGGTEREGQPVVTVSPQ